MLEGLITSTSFQDISLYVPAFTMTSATRELYNTDYEPES
jgi:hypothetical protein